MLNGVLAMDLRASPQENLHVKLESVGGCRRNSEDYQGKAPCSHHIALRRKG